MTKNETSGLFSRHRRLVALPASLALFLSATLILVLTLIQVGGVGAQTGLQVEIVTAYNLVVDSNVSSPSTYGPSVATVMGRFCNTSGSTLSNVQGYIGDYNPLATNGTPGLYPSRNSADATFIAEHPALANTGIYRFEHVGGRIGTTDAERFVGDLAPGECKVQYWHLSYPQCSSSEAPPCSGTPTWGDSVKPQDDLWLTLDVWATADGGYADDASWTMTMRNEISALANKIQPNPDGVWFNTKASEIAPGDVITSNGVRYTFGNIRFGFDNDGDSNPDYNAWAQPVGDSAYDPTCFRLIRTSGVITITRGGSQEILAFSDQDPPHPTYGGPLYFGNLPSDNTAVDGNIYYTFQALDGPCSTALSPYQEVASGWDNEKFNGDYGTGIPPIVSYGPQVTLAKSSSPNRLNLGQQTTYQIPFANTSTTSDAGLGLSTGGSTPLVISDTIPSGMEYVAGSATAFLNFANTGYTVRYSTDSGATWSTTEPIPVHTVTTIQWWLHDALPAGSSGNYAQFTALVPVSYTGSPFIDNCADARFGNASPFAEACAPIMILGDNSVGDLVWQDENGDGLQDAGEPGIPDITVTLYWDRNSDGQLDDGDILLDTQETDGSGNYLFDQLPDARYLVQVDSLDPDLPTGYRPTTDKLHAVDLDSAGTDPAPVAVDWADFGFGPSLGLTKSAVAGVYEGHTVLYNLTVSNLRPGGGTPVPGGCQYTVWSNTQDPDHSGSNNSTRWQNEPGAFGAGGPDGVYAYSDYANALNAIAGTGYDLGSQDGTITNVEAVFSLYVQGSLVDDYGEGYLWFNGAQIAPPSGSQVFTPAELNTFGSGSTAQGLLAWDVTTARSWDWADFQGDLDLQLDTHKNAGIDGATVYLDAIGFRVTSDAECRPLDPDDVMTTVPLTDTYDTSLLQFISAGPPESSIDMGSGLITWDNIGPIYPGQSVNVQVTFLALEPISGLPTDALNDACATGATFADGLPTNDACDDATVTITPTGSIAGVVWSEGAGGTDGWIVNPTGYEPGIDWGVPGVTAVLWVCEWDDGSGYVPVPAPNNNKDCEAQSIPGAKGQWTAVMTETTGADGSYLFGGLLDAYYLVEVDPVSLPASTPTGTADPDYTANGSGSSCPPGTCDHTWGARTANLIGTNPLNSLDNAEDIVHVNFGYTLPAAIYGTVWEDNDGDGSHPAEPGENGFDSVTVELYDGTGALYATALTDANGNYEFLDLPPDTYTIRVIDSTLPTNDPGDTWTQTFDPDDACLPTPGGGCDDAHTVSVTQGQISGSHDFGYHRSGDFALGDTLYVDWNGDGDQDTGEEGIPDVTVYLYQDDNGDGVIDPAIDGLIAATTTGSDGDYSFGNLAAQSYMVVVDESDPEFPANHAQTQDPDEDPGVCTRCDGQGSATLGPDDLTVDFGYQPFGAGSIGDFVWQDDDGDGIQDPGELGIPNITVELYEDSNGDGVLDPATDALVATTETDANGNYLFTGLAPDHYLVDVDTGDNDLPTDGNGQPYVLSTDNDPHAVNLGLGEEYLDADFGFTTGGTIGDLVWQDTDGNGFYDFGEPGIAKVAVTLYVDNDGDGHVSPGDTVYDQATTGPDGLYEFTSLPSQQYVVSLDASNFAPGGPLEPFDLTYDPDGYSTDPANPFPPCNPACTDCDSQSGVNLAPGQTDRSHDFGFQPQSSLGDYVWFDQNGDGVQDAGETPIAGVTLELLDGASNVLATTTTDGYGYYAFANLAPGTYIVRVDDTTLPPGVDPTYDLDGGTTSPDGRATVTLGPDEVRLDLDFGYSGLNSVAGTVFYDPNDNAIQDLDETATFEGVTVNLWDCGADGTCGTGDDTLVGTAITDANGDYLFENLADGNYMVAVRSSSPPLDGQNPTVTSSPTTYRFVALDPGNSNPAGVHVPDQDFGFWDGNPTAITLAYLNAEPDGDAILLTWETISEIDTLGFNLYRAQLDEYGEPVEPRTQLNADLLPGQAAPGSLTGAIYHFTDVSVQPHITYYYWLEDVDIYGVSTLHGPVEAALAVAKPATNYRIYLPVVFK